MKMPKYLFPALALALAVLACNAPVSVTNPPAAASTDTQTLPAPVALTETPSLTLPAPVSTSGLTADVLRNGTYYAPAYTRTVTLVNGSYSEGSGASAYSVQMMNIYAFGDLNGDHIDDAAILLVENGGGTGQFVSLVVVAYLGGAPLQVGQTQLGDRVQVNSVDITGAVIHLEMLIQGPSDPMCCPSLAEKQSYWIISGQLWLMRVTTTTSGTERSINIDSPYDWADVTNPFTVTGNVPISPFENTLAYRIYLPDGTSINESSLLVSSAGMGTPGTFSHAFDLSMAGVTGTVIIQFLDLSAADGSTLALGSVVVNLH